MVIVVATGALFAKGKVSNESDSLKNRLYLLVSKDYSSKTKVTVAIKTADQKLVQFNELKCNVENDTMKVVLTDEYLSVISEYDTHMTLCSTFGIANGNSCNLNGNILSIPQEIVNISLSDTENALILIGPGDLKGNLPRMFGFVNGEND